jgi:hypothetical protein
MKELLVRMFLGPALLRLAERVAVAALGALGTAFGPKGALLLAGLPEDEQNAWIAKAPVLGRTHDDWPRVLQWVPRKFSSWVPAEGAVFPQPILSGNTDLPKPIPAVGLWWAGRGFVTGTFDVLGRHLHLRLGWRPDDVDGYWALSAAVKLV